MGASSQNNMQFMEGSANVMVELAKRDADDAIWNNWVAKMGLEEYKKILTEFENAGMMGYVGEDAIPPEIDANPGFSQSFEPQIISGKIVMTRIAEVFGRKDFIAARTKQLAKSHGRTLNNIAHAFLELGNVAQASIPSMGAFPLIWSVGADGKLIFANNHIYKTPATGTVTYSNISAAFADPTETAINTFMVQVALWPDNQGQPFDYILDQLIIPKAQEMTATKTLQSVYTPDSANNAVNVGPMFVKNKSLVSSPYFESQTNWYIKTNCEQENLIIFCIRELAEKWTWRNPETRAIGNYIMTILSPRVLRARILKVTA